ncbi:MAG: hypothetical protein AAF627_09960 [Myxococcota bacterium]
MKSKREGGRWRAWAFYRGRRIDRRAATRREAERKVLDAIGEAEEQSMPRADEVEGVTVDEYVQRAVRAQGADVEERTWHRRLRAWWSLRGVLADMSLTNLTIPDVRDWRATLPAESERGDGGRGAPDGSRCGGAGRDPPEQPRACSSQAQRPTAGGRGGRAPGEGVFGRGGPGAEAGVPRRAVGAAVHPDVRYGASAR